MNEYRETVASSSYMLHALGGDGPRTYLNSLEVAEHRYREGARLFEADVSLTADHKLVLAHGWSKHDYVSRYGLPYTADSPVPTHAEFKSWKIQGHYETADIQDFVLFMQDHSDAFVMIDIGNQEYEETKDIYTELSALLLIVRC